MNLRDDFRIYWAMAAVYAIGIFLISANPRPPSAEAFIGIKIPYIDKIEHFFLYGIFGVILYMAVLKTESLKEKEFTGFLIGTLYAFTDEIHQYFVPGRSCDPLDFLVDVAGISAGMVFSLWKWRKL